MNTESDQPEGAARGRDTVPDPPGSGSPPSGSAARASGPSDPGSPGAAMPDDSASADAEPAAGRTRDRPRPGPQGEISPEEVRERLRRRAIFLRELAEARELRRRVTPHRSRRARIHAALRRRTFRIS
ncbi:MAG TPA: hypothetical protein VIL71_00030 [Spirillospora sp.]